MGKKRIFHSKFRLNIILLFAGLISFYCYCYSSSERNIIIENRNWRYEINSNGINLQFSDKVSGIDYLNHDTISYSSYIKKDGNHYTVTSVSRQGKNLHLEFADAGIKADVQIKKVKNGITFKVKDINGLIESLNFLNIPLILDGMPYEQFAACALSMNLYTHVRQIPALQNHLWATCYSRFGLEGAEVTVIGVPQHKILASIREVISHAEAIPFSDKGGAWALSQKEGYGSYLMNFGTLTEETVIDWIDMCRSLGFNQIDNHGGGDFFRFGDFELDSVKWPGGWDSFKRINAKLHNAGISSIFHTYAFFIDKNSKYVNPVPSSDLGYFNSFTLAEKLDEDDTEIVVTESTRDISTTTGFFVRNSLTLRIGSELIEFSDVTCTPPYKFTGCRRGACGTKISSFGAGEKAYHLRQMFGRFVPGPETELFNEIAVRTAAIVNKCNFDGIYFDAIDGSDILGGEENFWYYGTKFIFEVAKHLDPPVGMEMSSMSHHWWHYRSRWQAWDRPLRGYKRFIDIHSAAIKTPRLFLTSEIRSNENEHGLWRGHKPLIDKFASVQNGSMLLPLHLGWWGNQTWNPPQVEPTFPDDIEYLCCKMIGNNAGLSILGGVDEKYLNDNPLFKQLVSLIRQYEELRKENHFNDTICELLRQPGKEYTLFRKDTGEWSFKPITYKKHKVEGHDHPSSQWIVNNEFDSQPVKLRIEPLMSVRPFNDPANVVLADFVQPQNYVNKGSASGVSGDIAALDESAVGGGVSGLFYAHSKGICSQEGSWITMEKKFDPWLNISGNQALGVWVKGDGNGQLLNLRLESPRHLSHGARGDHFIKIDFTGWKYFELVEIESSEFSNYIWPDSGFYVYDSYRHTVLFDKIDKLQLWYNNLPAGKEVCCIIGPVKALPLVTAAIIDPSITVGDQKLTFKVKMESGMYLEFKSLNNCKLYGPKGGFLQDVTVVGNIPVIRKGDNQFSFTCIETEGINSRVQVTVVSEGNPL